MKYLPLFLSLAFAAPLLAIEGGKRDRDPASESSVSFKIIKIKTGSDEESMIPVDQEDLKGEEKGVNAAKEAVSGEHELETNAVVAEVLALKPPPTLGSMIIHLSHLLDVRDLCRLASVSRATRAGLFYDRIWMNRPLKIRLSVPFLSHIFTCGYPFKCSPVELVFGYGFEGEFDESKLLLIPKNMTAIFGWIIGQRTSNLTLNFDGIEENGDVNETCGNPNFSYMLDQFGMAFMQFREEMPIITSLGLSCACIPDCQYPSPFCEAIKTLIQNVTHLNLNAMLIGDDNLFPFLLKNPTLFLNNLESLTLRNYVEDYVFFTHMAVPFLKSKLKSLTIRTYFTQSDDDLPKVWPHQLEYFELEEVRIQWNKGGDYKAIFLPLAQNKKLKSVVMKGSPFNFEDLGLSPDEMRSQQKQALSIVQSQLIHLDTLKLDWWYWYPEYQRGEFPERIV